MNVRCDYCGCRAERVTGAALYPNRPDLARRVFYRCARDNAWVGTHAKSGKPLGRLADHALRRWKQKAHAVFDPLWKSGRMRRAEAYAWLARQLGVREVHIGELDIEGCKRVVEVCKQETER